MKKSKDNARTGKHPHFILEYITGAGAAVIALLNVIFSFFDWYTEPVRLAMSIPGLALLITWFLIDWHNREVINNGRNRDR